MSIIQMSASGALIIFITEILRHFTLNRLPAHTFTVLWTVAAVRLIVPFSIPSRFSVFYAIDKIYSSIVGSESHALELFPASDAASVAFSPGTDSSVSEYISNGYIHYSIILAAVWILGILITAGIFCYSYMKNVYRFREAVPVKRPLLNELTSAMHIHRHIALKETDYIQSPLTYGIFRPVLLLNKGLNDVLDDDNMSLILTHELVHIKRADSLRKLLLAVIVCIHWFNPMVWVMYILANRDMEMTCDQSVVRLLGSNSRPSYAEMLIRFAEYKSCCQAGLNSFSRTALTERVTAILNRSASYPLRAAAALAVVLLMSATMMTSSYITEHTEIVRQNISSTSEKLLSDISSAIGSGSDSPAYVYSDGSVAPDYKSGSKKSKVQTSNIPASSDNAQDDTDVSDESPDYVSSQASPDSAVGYDSESTGGSSDSDSSTSGEFSSESSPDTLSSYI